MFMSGGGLGGGSFLIIPHMQVESAHASVDL